MSRTTTTVFAGAILLLLSMGAPADIHAQAVWHDFYGIVTFNGQSAPVGSIIDAYDPQSVHCGRDTVRTAGYYGFMPVYGDDLYEPGDQGAEAGDTISFKVNGRDAVSTPYAIWQGQGHQDSVDLSATGTVAISGVDLPGDSMAAPDDTICFAVGVRNDGDGLDFYGVTSASLRGWETINDSSISYADSGEIVYIWFEVIVPTFPGDTTDTITFSVFSHLDTSQHVDGSVGLTVSTLGIYDEPFAETPGGFQLNQNYPNPFNPSTTISFTLELRSRVRLDVIDLLGRCVDTRDLGVLPSGDHGVEYETHGLPSGVYLYRIVTESGSLARKMVLLK